MVVLYKVHFSRRFYCLCNSIAEMYFFAKHKLHKCTLGGKIFLFFVFLNHYHIRVLAMRVRAKGLSQTRVPLS